MKSINYALSFIAFSFTFILSACTLSDSLENIFNSSDQIKADIEDVTIIDDSSSRSAISSDSKFVWTKGDLIGITITNGSTTSMAPYKLSSGEGTSEGTFIGSISPSYQLGENAIYPYSKQNTISSNSLTLTMPSEYDYTNYDTEAFGDINNGEVNNMNMPMWAKIDNGELHFEHLGGYFIFEISKIPAGSNKFEFTIKNKKKITGAFNVNLSESSPIYTTSESNTDNTVIFRFTPSENTCQRVFCVPVPVGEYEYEWNIYNDKNELKGFGMSNEAKTINRKDVRISRRECSSINGDDSQSEDSSDGDDNEYKTIELTYNLSSSVWQEAKYMDVYVPSGATLDYSITSDVTVPGLRSGNYMTLWKSATDEAYISNKLPNYTLEKDVPFRGSVTTTVFHSSIPLLLRHTTFAQTINITFKYRIIQNKDDSNNYYEVNYPNEVSAVKGLFKEAGTNLSFVHISDSHSIENNWSNADGFTDYIGADFLVHTGDILDNSDIQTNAIVGRITSMNKPCYLVPGNHDYSVLASSSTLANSTHFFNRFLSATNEHNKLSTSKTYYSVVKSGVRSVFIDIYDDFCASSTGSPMASYVKMTKAQVNWLISELQAAKNAEQTVVIFTHCGFPSNSELAVKGWDDCSSSVGRSNGNSGCTFLLNLIDAYMDGSTYSFTHNGNSFTASFQGKGTFAGWFAGHEHSDFYGRIEDHERQWQCITAATANHKNVTIKDFKGCCSWVMVSPTDKKVTIYRMGEQETTNGYKRDLLSYNFQ